MGEVIPITYNVERETAATNALSSATTQLHLFTIVDNVVDAVLGSH